MTHVTVRFSTHLLSLLSGGRYFGRPKRILHMGTSKNKIAKNVNLKEYFLRKGNVYPVL